MVDSNKDNNTDGGINNKSVSNISNNSTPTRVNLQRMTRRERNALNRSKNRKLDKEAYDRVKNSDNPENLDSETKRRSENRIRALNQFKTANVDIKKRRQTDKAYDEKCKSDARRRSKLYRDRKKAAKEAAAKRLVTESEGEVHGPTPEVTSQKISTSDKKRKTRSSSTVPKNKLTPKDNGLQSNSTETPREFSSPISIPLPVATLLPTIEITNNTDHLPTSATSQVTCKGNTTSPMSGSCSVSERSQNTRKTLQEFHNDSVIRQNQRFHSRSHEFDREGLTEEQCESVESVRYDLELWGMNLGTNASDKIINCLKDEFKTIESSLFSMPKAVGLPKTNVFDAFRFVLDNEMHTSRTKFGMMKDQLNFRTRNGLNKNLSIDEHNKELYGRPYKKDKDKSGNIVLRDGFGAISLNDVFLPLDRFKWIGLSKRDSLYESFVTNKNTLSGYYFETMVAWKMEHSYVKCMSCRTTNLKWNGGSDTPWMDVVCTHCNSTYEIKSRSSCQRGFFQMQNNRLEGGSFSSFCILEKHFRHCVQTRHYCVIVGRDSIRNNYYQAAVGLISKVLPIVNIKSFDRNRTEPAKFKSIIKMQDFYNWIQIPVPSFEGFEFSSWSEIAEKGFNDHFTNDQSRHSE